MMTEITGTPFGLIFLPVLALGLSPKQSFYELALDKSIKYALIQDLFKPLDMQEYRDDMKITKILHVPPYSKFAKKIHTAKPGKPVEIKYMFHAIRDPDVPHLRKGLLCTASINEFNLDDKFYYVLPYRKNLKCEDYPEDEEDEEFTSKSHSNHHHLPQQSDYQMNKMTGHRIPDTLGTHKPIAVRMPKTIRTTRVPAIHTTTTKPTSTTRSTTIKVTNKPYSTTESTTFFPQTTTDDVLAPLLHGMFDDEPKENVIKHNDKIASEANTPKEPNLTKLRNLSNKHKYNSEPGRDMESPEPRKDRVVRYKLHDATLNVDLSGLVDKGIGAFLPLNENKERIVENAVINIKLGSSETDDAPIQNTSVYTKTSSNNQSRLKEHRYSLKDASVYLNKAEMGDDIPEFFSPFQRSLLARIKQR